VTAFLKARGTSWVSFDKSKVISTFKEHGFNIWANIEDDLNKEDAGDVAKFLVGQNLIADNRYSIFRSFVNDWKQKFGKQKLKEDEKINNIKKSLAS
jgi:hypothetical protein